MIMNITKWHAATNVCAFMRFQWNVKQKEGIHGKIPLFFTFWNTCKTPPKVPLISGTFLVIKVHFVLININILSKKYFLNANLMFFCTFKIWHLLSQSKCKKTKNTHLLSIRFSFWPIVHVWLTISGSFG